LAGDLHLQLEKNTIRADPEVDLQRHYIAGEDA